jgi:hypothetical protein
MMVEVLVKHLVDELDKSKVDYLESKKESKLAGMWGMHLVALLVSLKDAK